MNGKTDLTQLFKRVDSILWSDWDPIGVNDNQEAHGEYTSYVPAIVKMLIDDADELKLAHHLQQVERTSMGISSGFDHCSHVARKLLHSYKGG